MAGSAFAAYHRIVAGDLDPPDWPVRGASDASDEGRARKELADELGPMAISVGQHCADLVFGWRDAAAAEVARRQRREQGRELVRLCMRAWREVCDGVRPFTAEFDQAFSRGTCSLARRVAFVPPGEGASRWPAGVWPAVFVLEWMRLVRAGTVRRARRRSPAWLEARVRWQHALSDAMRAPWQQGDAAGDRDARAVDVARRRQLGREKDEQRAQAKRLRRAAAAAPASAPGHPSDGDGGPAAAPVPACSKRVRADAGCPSDGDDGPAGGSKRVRTDAVLRLRPSALAALRVALAGAPPEGLCAADARRARGVG